MQAPTQPFCFLLSMLRARGGGCGASRVSPGPLPGTADYTFDAVDADADGTLSRADLAAYLSAKGSAIDVDELLKDFGADVCRWWVCSLPFGNDIKVDLDFFKVAGESYRKIRNTLRFLLGNLADFEVERDGMPLESIEPESIDAWALAEAVRVVRESGLPNETNAMFTNIEGEWDEVMAVVKRAVDVVAATSPRVGLVLKADIRPGHEGQLAAKVQRIEQRLDGTG